MTPGRAGVLVLGRDHIGHIVKMQFFFSFCLHWGMDQTLRLSILMMAKEESTKIVKFMTPGAGVLVLWRGHVSHKVKMHYFFKNLLLYSGACSRQNKCIVIITKEGSTKIVNVMISGAGAIVFL